MGYSIKENQHILRMEKDAQSVQKTESEITENILKMKSEAELIERAGFKHVKYSKTKDVVILFTAFERDDNNRFISDMTRAIRLLETQKKKISPKNLSIVSKYPIKEIELNLHEITTIMDALGID